MQIILQIKHNLNLNETVDKLREVVKVADETGSTNSKDYKVFGLKSRIVVDTAHRYLAHRNKDFKWSFKGSISSCGTKLNHETGEVSIPCLKWKKQIKFPHNPARINYVDFDKQFLYLAYTPENYLNLNLPFTQLLEE